jgi:hypothetical protein
VSTRVNSTAELIPPSTLVPAAYAGGHDPADLMKVGPLGLPPSSLPPKLKPRAVRLSVSTRCSEKGCVFPALPGSGGRCMNHQRQQQEPDLCLSQQPSSILVARGKFGPARVEEIERGERRESVKDRRRMMAERERFLGE